MKHIENKTYHLKLSVVTPLSIGTGSDNDWIQGIDYEMKPDGIHIIDYQRKDIYSPIPAPDCSTNAPIKTFIRSKLHNCPLIPGSSIKGAIRSVIFQYLYEKTGNVLVKKNIKEKEYERKLFGSASKGTDFMRFLQIGDFEMPVKTASPGSLPSSGTEILNTIIFNLHRVGSNWKGGWKHDRNSTHFEFKPDRCNTFYECIVPGKSATGRITLKSNAIGLLQEYHPTHQEKDELTLAIYDEIKSILDEDITPLFRLINAHTRWFLEKELAFFKAYYDGEEDDQIAEGTYEIRENIKKLITQIPSDNNSCLLRMSAGSGFHSITGDWKYRDFDETGYWHNGKKKYKSRKIVDFACSLQLMGFVKLTLI